MAEKRDAKGRFVKGNAPKSPGRPAAAKEFREKCRQFMESPGGGWDILIEMAKGKGPHKQRSLELIASYAYGKPPQKLEHSGDPENPLGVVILPDVNR